MAAAAQQKIRRVIRWETARRGRLFLAGRIFANKILRRPPLRAPQNDNGSRYASLPLRNGARARRPCLHKTRVYTNKRGRHFQSTSSFKGVESVSCNGRVR